MRDVKIKNFIIRLLSHLLTLVVILFMNNCSQEESNNLNKSNSSIGSNSELNNLDNSQNIIENNTPNTDNGDIIDNNELNNLNSSVNSTNNQNNLNNNLSNNLNNSNPTDNIDNNIENSINNTNNNTNNNNLNNSSENNTNSNNLSNSSDNNTNNNTNNKNNTNNNTNNTDSNSQNNFPIVDLLADTNRDGIVDLNDDTDDIDEDFWDAEAGAVFLANLDDDEQRCSNNESDEDLAECNDSSDNIINGDNDLKDMAKLIIRPWPNAPLVTECSLKTDDVSKKFIRLFIKRNEIFEEFDLNNGVIDINELKNGCEFVLEGLDIVRDRDYWDGFVDFVLTVNTQGIDGVVEDKVRMRVAPIILRNHLDSPKIVYAAPYAEGYAYGNEFFNDLKDAVSEAGIEEPVVELDTDDPWAQDFFETAYMSMPNEDGMHVIHVNLRSANLEQDWWSSNLRASGKLVFTKMRGPDRAGIQQYNDNDGDVDTLNSMGNTETIPPYVHNGVSYPLGRILRGSIPSYYPDTAFSKMLESQDVQPPVYLNTSWLSVGHVDETISFVKANNERGWTLIVNDAILAKTMLEQAVEQGFGRAVMFEGKSMWNDWGQMSSAAATISQVLNDPDIMSESLDSAVYVSEQIETLKDEIGFEDDELLKAPFLHMSYYGGSAAYQPGTVNGISLGDYHFGVPEPHGPIVNGVDIMKKQYEDELGKEGIVVHWIENWDFLHIGGGEVHCGSNTTREVSQNIKWWENGI